MECVCDFCGGCFCVSVGVMGAVGMCHCLCRFVSGEKQDFCGRGLASCRHRPGWHVMSEDFL
jgi:hypothetical protein